MAHNDGRSPHTTVVPTASGTASERLRGIMNKNPALSARDYALAALTGVQGCSLQLMDSDAKGQVLVVPPTPLGNAMSKQAITRRRMESFCAISRLRA